MCRAILEHSILVLSVAPCINSVILYIVSNNMTLTTSSQDMKHTTRTISGVLDYDGNLMNQMHKLGTFTNQDSSRVTLIRADGTVITGSDAGAEYLSNHLGREEIRMTMEKEEGHTRRYSGTLGKTTLHVTCRSGHADTILRLTVPYSSIGEHLPMLLPAAIVNFGAAMLCSLTTIQWFVSSVTRSMKDISRKMLQIKRDYTELHLDRYRYLEINVAAETITNVSQSAKEYLSQIDREEQIRQGFFSDASRELKTPIISIQGYVELLENGVIQDESMEMDFARRIKKEAVNMIGLIDDILTVSRLGAKNAEMVMIGVRISVLLEEIMNSLEPQAAPGQVFMHVDCQPPCIKTNVQQIKELLTNLLSNATKYNRPRGQVWINIREQDDNMAIRVRDNGMGTPEESLDRVFERFHHMGKGHSRKQGGTGLGLSIVKHIVNFCHGIIHATSRLEQGTESVVSLPLDRYEKQIVRKKIHSIAPDLQEFKVVKLMVEFFCSMIENIPERE